MSKKSMRGSRTTKAPSILSAQVAETRALLDQAVAVDVPELEAAIRAGDYDLAFARGAIVRDIRNRVRGLLGGADGSGPLRAEWARVEGRIDAALVAAPRPNSDPRTGRQTWQTQRTARGTDAHRRRPRLTGATGMASRRPRTSHQMLAVNCALGDEVYYPPTPPQRDDVDPDAGTIRRRLPLPRDRDR